MHRQPSFEGAASPSAPASDAAEGDAILDPVADCPVVASHASQSAEQTPAAELEAAESAVQERGLESMPSTEVSVSGWTHSSPRKNGLGQAAIFCLRSSIFLPDLGTYQAHALVETYNVNIRLQPANTFGAACCFHPPDGPLNGELLDAASA